MNEAIIDRRESGEGTFRDATSHRGLRNQGWPQIPA